ncbi:Peptide chain release factor 1 [Frankliniella fusca]|uniref:Peptide chain release factor 1 n=1 Tax=Frankliniella fusca TaxID=407009 RepID=A0AAE1GW43_9NEOP|nr:Peptide chain release factor 1 [Frankliniella fusca]
MSSGEESEGNIPHPPKRRKQWMKGGRVPRETYRRWLTQARPAVQDSDEDSSEEDVNLQNNFDAEQQAINDGALEDLDVEAHQEEIFEEDGDSERESLRSIISNLISDSDQENVSSSSESGAEHDDNPLSIPLFPGSKTTKGEAISKLLDVCCKHATSKALLNDLVVYIYNLLPKFNTFPSTPYFFEKAIGPYIPPDLCVSHYCCEKCGAYLGTPEERENNCVCDVTAEKIFYEFPLATQLKYLFEERNLADVMDSYEIKVGNSSDITTGEEYLKVKSNLKGKYDVILLTNSDGLQPHNNSTEEIWAVTYTICEVPPGLRRVFTMVTQIWYGKKKPFMNGFMVPFAKSTIELFQKGVVWTHPKSKIVHTTRGTAPAFTLDAPARAMLQNVTSHSGSCSCNICEIEGERIKHGKGTKTIFPYVEDEELVLRDKDAMEAQTQSLLLSGIVCKGVRGDSILNTIPLCNRGSAVIYDYMHLVLLGVTRQFYCMFMKGERNGLPTKGIQKPPWYIGHKSKIIDVFLSSIERTYEFTRFPKYCDKYKAYKAQTWLTWLLFVSILVFHENLPEVYSQHWLLLVIAINLLLKEVISQDDVEMARLLLSEFVEEAQQLYGKEVMTYNVHGLLHMALMVKRWGALWATSTFLFESYNGVIVRNLHGTIHIQEEFANVFGRHVANATLRNVVSNADVDGTSGPCVMGKMFYSDLSVQELELLQQQFPDASQRVPLYARVRKGKTVYTSVSYSAEKATNNKNVSFKLNGKTAFGVLKYFYQSQGKIVAFVNVLGVDAELQFRHHATNLCVSHIVPIFPTQEICIIQIPDIICKLIRVGGYLCIPPNNFERNL